MFYKLYSLYSMHTVSYNYSFRSWNFKVNTQANIPNEFYLISIVKISRNLLQMLLTFTVTCIYIYGRLFDMNVYQHPLGKKSFILMLSVILFVSMTFIVNIISSAFCIYKRSKLTWLLLIISSYNDGTNAQW